MRLLLSALGGLAILLQIQLWSGVGGLAELIELQARVQDQRAQNASLRERNAALAERVSALQSGASSIEAMAREELGLIAEGETLYIFSPHPRPVVNP
ncbi:MAG: septum formation initiator family protein [Pseudomonadota bacterium]|nr:septum formation initiator family protein [Pseudomonadota bacterium]